MSLLVSRASPSRDSEEGKDITAFGRGYQKIINFWKIHFRNGFWARAVIIMTGYP